MAIAYLVGCDRLDQVGIVELANLMKRVGFEFPGRCWIISRFTLEILQLLDGEARCFPVSLYYTLDYTCKRIITTDLPYAALSDEPDGFSLGSHC